MYLHVCVLFCIAQGSKCPLSESKCQISYQHLSACCCDIYAHTFTCTQQVSKQTILLRNTKSADAKRFFFFFLWQWNKKLFNQVYLCFSEHLVYSVYWCVDLNFCHIFTITLKSSLIWNVDFFLPPWQTNTHSAVLTGALESLRQLSGLDFRKFSLAVYYGYFRQWCNELISNGKWKETVMRLDRLK